MALINKDEFARASKLTSLGLNRFSGPLMKVLKLDSINDLYRRFEDKEGLAFIDALFTDLKVDFTFYEEELKRIPAGGAFFTVSNHPLGGVDGLILLKLLGEHRPDYKVMVNFLLQKVDPLKGFFLPVNPFENLNISSYEGLKGAMSHIASGHPLGIFPAGAVSHYDFKQRKIIDAPWQPGAIKLMRKMNVPIVPIYFQARNSFWFYVLSALHPDLQTVKLPSEIMSKRRRSIRLRIGNPILPKEYEKLSVAETVTLLERRTHLLGKALPPPKPFYRNLSAPFTRRNEKKPLPIIEPADRQVLQAEIESLKARGKRLLESKNYEVYFAEFKDIPAASHEIGRWREIAFRAVGEGTFQPTDLDAFDVHYHHLFLWDTQSLSIAGAYRVGMGQHIFPKKGLKGFYVPTLFKIDKPAEVLFSHGLELGRAFVVPEHQQKPLPLFLLWKGIIEILKQYPEHKYITGCVSISNDFSKFSRGLMVAFIKKYFFDTEMGGHIHPRKSFKLKSDKKALEALLNETENDLRKLDKLLAEIEPGSLRAPVLLKKYIKQNARIAAFNVDPAFNNALDGFMYINVEDLPDNLGI
ncbi:MAG: lysophospholipid acyltransferase family protein [Cryomorphaceae bacterium]|nr:lysophospholipid acyltransferase family protein [Cryomorphaceae bacterium]